MPIRGPNCVPIDNKNRSPVMMRLQMLYAGLGECKRRSKNPSLKRPVGPVAPE